MMKMAQTFARLYGATSFDPDDHGNKIGEAARQLMLSTADEVVDMVRNGQDLPFLLGGLLVGLVQIVQATAQQGDEADASIRASIMQLAPWAVDMARSAQGKEPLVNA